MIGNLTLANDIWALQEIEQETRRAAEKDSAEAANSRDYKLSPESIAALERGDRQRETGIYQTEDWRCLYCHVPVKEGYPACDNQACMDAQIRAERRMGIERKK